MYSYAPYVHNIAMTALLCYPDRISEKCWKVRNVDCFERNDTYAAPAFHGYTGYSFVDAVNIAASSKECQPYNYIWIEPMEEEVGELAYAEWAASNVADICECYNTDDKDWKEWVEKQLGLTD